MWWAWTSIALAIPLPWQLGDASWYVEDEVLLEAGEAQLSVEEGYLFEVIDPEGTPAGFVVVGDAAAVMRFPDGLQAAVAVNRLSTSGEQPATVAAVGRGDGWSTPVDLAIVFGSGRRIPLSAKQVDGDGGVVVYESAGGQEEVLVTDLPGLGAARRRARAVLNERTEAWTRASLDPRTPVILDGLEGRPGTRWIAGVRVTGSPDTPWARGRWLTWTHDPTGIVDPTWAGAVRPGLHTTGAVISAARLPETDGGRPAAPRRVALQGAGITGMARVMTGGQATDLGVVADLQIRAVGGPAQLVVLDVPHVEQQGFYGMPPLPNGYELIDVVDPDGQPLEVVPVPLTPDQRDGRGRHRTIAVRLAQALPAGEITTIRVRWRDRARYAHLLQGATLTLLDTSTGAVRLLPTVRGGDGRLAPVRVRAGISSEIDRDTVAAAGVERHRETPREGLEWVEVDTTSAGALMAAGRFRQSSIPGAPGLPDISVWVQTKADAANVASNLAAMTRVIDPLVPAWPDAVVAVDGATIVDDVGRADGAGGGLLELHQVYDWENVHMPHAATLAAAMVLDRWRELGVDGEAAEISALASHLAGWWMLDALGDRSAIAYWRSAIAGQARPNGGPLVHDDHLLGHRLALAAIALPETFGEASVQLAFTRLLAGEHPATWEGLAEALTATSGLDATPFVTLWLASGVRPSLDVTWRHDPEARELLAWVTSDAPRGGHRLQVTVHGKPGRRSVTVPLRDGVGRVRVPWDGEAPRRLSVDASDLPLRRVDIRQLEPDGDAAAGP